MVRLGLEFASPGGANRGEDGELAFVGKDKKTFVTESVIDAFSGILGNRPRVDKAQAASLADSVSGINGAATARYHAGRDDEELSAIHRIYAVILSCSKLEDQTGEKAVVEILTDAVIDRENIH